MQKAFDLIVERLEELDFGNSCGNCFYRKECEEYREKYKPNENYDLCALVAKVKAIEIVNQVAEEYKTDIEFAEKCVELAGKMNVCDLVAENQRLSRKIMFLEAEKESNNGWIPCSERLPEIAGHEVLATLENKLGQRRVTVIFTGYGLSPFWHCNHKEFDLNVWKVIAWHELPQPYQPKGE